MKHIHVQVTLKHKSLKLSLTNEPHSKHKPLKPRLNKETHSKHKPLKRSSALKPIRNINHCMNLEFETAK
jgi:hypothetical protein